MNKNMFKQLFKVLSLSMRKKNPNLKKLFFFHMDEPILKM